MPLIPRTRNKKEGTATFSNDIGLRHNTRSLTYYVIIEVCGEKRKYYMISSYIHYLITKKTNPNIEIFSFYEKTFYC